MRRDLLVGAMLLEVFKRLRQKQPLEE